MIHAPLPTTDLYFVNACKDLIGGWLRRGPVRRLGANTFRCGNRLLLIRRDAPELIERALAWPGRLIYLIDDDIDGGAQSPGLPSDYRDRLARFAQGPFDRLLRRADLIVASSDVLAERLRSDDRPRGEIVRLDPYWPLPLADQSHFGTIDTRIEIAHLGTGSHAAGLARAAPAILAMLDHCPEARFTYIGKPAAHPTLEAHPRATRLAPMGWARYRPWLPRQRFHLALYPLAPTPFDRARSANKLIEHGIVGAVGLYPEDWGPAALLGDGAILAPNDPSEWEECLHLAVKRRDKWAQRGAAASLALAQLNDPAQQRRFWAHHLMRGAVP
jgi:hypothetical protein